MEKKVQDYRIVLHCTSSNSIWGWMYGEHAANRVFKFGDTKYIHQYQNCKFI
jgi:hypothetical protein